MDKVKLKSHTPQKFLVFGEKVRENPRTILLSIPIFLCGLFYYWLRGNREGIAGSLGHMGIAFKNYHKHHWQKDFLLRIAYFLFDKSSYYAHGEGKVSTILHAGQAAYILKDYLGAEKKFLKALKEVGREKVKTGIDGYVYVHLALLEIEGENLEKARNYLDKGYEIIQKHVMKNINSLYLQVWMSLAELAKGEYWMAQGDRNTARIWAEKAQERADKYDLKVRKLDVKRLLSKIGKSV